MSRRCIAPGVLALCMAACSGGDDRHPTVAAVATVAGQPIPQDLLDAYARTKTGVGFEQLSPERRASLLEDLRRLKAAAIAGERSATATTRRELELQRLEALAHAAATAAGVYAVPSDAELHGAYQAYLRSLPASEFHVAHILVATEATASVLITRLEGRIDFAQLAREQSADDSRSRGGDLGWIAPGTLPASFTDAVASLKAGEFTKTPVHTQYGWHVIRLIEARASQAPPFEQVRAQLAVNLEQDRYRKFLDENLKAVSTVP
jgi:peptidyl-prolyl cis-trans isomerase C